MIKHLAQVCFLIQLFICFFVCQVCLVLWMQSPSIFHWGTTSYAFGLLYTQITLFVASVMPERYIYQYHDTLQTMHRSRYLIECFFLPSFIWIFLFTPHNFLGLVNKPIGATVKMGAAGVHLFISLWAAKTCATYQFTMNATMGVLVWKPCRFFREMLYPTIISACAAGAYAMGELWMNNSPYLTILALAYYFANTKGRLQGKTFPGEVIWQQAISILLLISILYLVGITVKCRSLIQCVAMSHDGIGVPMFLKKPPMRF